MRLKVKPDEATGGEDTVAIGNAIASNNSADGMYIDTGGGAVRVSVDSSTMSNNGLDGLIAKQTAVVWLGRNLITTNDIGVANVSSSLYSFGDNHIAGDRLDVDPPFTGLIAPQ